MMSLKNVKVIADCRLSYKCVNFLKSNGANVHFVPEIPCLEAPVSAHADMSMINIGKKWFIADDIHNIFTFFGDNRAVKRNKVKAGELLLYPENAQFNAAVVGKSLLCCTKSVDKIIVEYAKNNGYNIICVKQGFTKCSVCVVSDNAIITEDCGIAKACKQNGIDVLLLQTHSVRLNGYDYGFIGGCSGNFNRKVYFSGCIESHPEYLDIRDFCKVHGVKPISMSDEPLYDVGSILFYF